MSPLLRARTFTQIAAFIVHLQRLRVMAGDCEANAPVFAAMIEAGEQFFLVGGEFGRLRQYLRHARFERADDGVIADVDGERVIGQRPAIFVMHVVVQQPGVVRPPRRALRISRRWQRRKRRYDDLFPESRAVALRRA